MPEPSVPPGAIDCDVHPAIPDTRVLLPYFEPYWREHVLRRGLERENFELSAFPSKAAVNARPDWISPAGPPGSSLDAMRTQLLDRWNLRYAICNLLHGGPAIFAEDLAAAFCRAANDWLRAEWLDREPRLRASITVPTCSPVLAAAEIDRLAPDRRFVQVLVLSMNEIPLGRRQNWPIFEAAVRHDLPLGIHAGGLLRHPPSAGGWGSTYLEDYVSHSQGFAGAMTSLVAEGVFVKFPTLRVVLLESGVTWFPSWLWRIDKTWRGVRAEVPWLDRRPTEVIRERVRLTLQPFDSPPGPAQAETVLRGIGDPSMLLFASDYPHWHYDGDAALPDGLPEAALPGIVAENALATYPRLA